MQIAAVQYRPPWGRPAQARRQLCALVARAFEGGARLVVCPEMATSGYVFSSEEEIAPFLETSEGPTFQALAGLSRAHAGAVVCGIPERHPDGLFNSALVLDKGDLLACYRKNLLYDLDETWARPGTERVVVSIDGVRLAPGICMDLNDDAFNAFLNREQPEIVAFPTNWIDQGRPMLGYWRWRLSGWSGHFVAANRWGVERGTPFYGRSAILGPLGQVLALAGPTGDGVISASTA